MNKNSVDLGETPNCLLRHVLLLVRSLLERTEWDEYLKQGHHHNDDGAARRPHILCSICFYSFGSLVKTVWLFIASLHNQSIYPKMCSIDIFNNLQLVGWNLKGRLFDPRLEGLGGALWDRGILALYWHIRSICFPFGVIIWHQKHFFPSVHTSDPFMMTNTALEAIASLSGKKTLLPRIVEFYADI